jgi:adenosylmethionine-8-amino-7-oxononanoate aminotransferase
MSLAERDAQVIWHPFTVQKNMPEPIAIVQGKGSLLIDDKGNEYIDAISSWWVTIHGHAHPYIAQKIYEQALQLEQVIFAGFTHEPAVELAEKLLTILPANFSKIFYSDNGSTSTEVALKMAIQYWWNQKNLADGSLKSEIIPTKILAFNNSYHGDTFGAMSVSDRSVFTMAFKDLLFEVIFIDTPTPENLHQTLQTIESNAKYIAAFIYEPLVQGAGGMNIYEPNLLNTILQTVQQHNIICIADEVMTGFGRTGKLFASEYMPIKPDIICLSKGLTGGTMALGVTACSHKIYNAFVSNDKLKTFFHGHSFTANPLACTAAIASFNLLQQNNSIAIVEWITEQNIQFAQQLKQYEPSIINIRTLGTILAFEINVGKKEYLNNIATTITQQALNEGVYIRPLGNTVYIMPPYCITKNELAKIYSTIVKIIEAV